MAVSAFLKLSGKFALRYFHENHITVPNLSQTTLKEPMLKHAIRLRANELHIGWLNVSRFRDARQ